ncbi:tyrosine-type recombinase/integrase [Variovorax sp. LG9.2]|uniref:tyrosine-type recombinase/integrase n=1 Tax=Variovorax sp. LG9.2 TaxID=3048626 RepID=UPI002B234FCA|nr:integrase arm-type DNA-binding domain-containing protein [Variovorax sp. LG9.2]MEB0057588.1 integrase arm-type DNA-binding domain-containing protein [Variovorax sp. LG9.2]
MPKKAVELGPLQVNRLVTPGRHAVGGVAGLHLIVSDSGARSWVLRSLIAGKRRDMGLGGFPDVTLAQARERARVAREQIHGGTDPIQARTEARSALVASKAAAKTFNECVTGLIEARASEWKNAKHKQQWQNSLDMHAGPVIGELLVKDVGLAQVLKVLEPIWHTTTETATRVRGRIENVLDWATVRGYRTGDNPARWKGHLDQLLAKPNKIATVKHHEAVAVDDLAAFVADLRRMDGTGARALEFAIFTAARSGEVRGALWSEIDTAAALWIVPAERMKAKREHRVPLSKQALALLAALPRIKDVDIVFPGSKNQILSDMTLSAVMRRMEVDAVPHGFRSTFRDWASERTNFPRELAEMALAHTIESKVEAAYRRGDLLAKRLKMMQTWADFCETPVKKGNVMPHARKA